MQRHAKLRKANDDNEAGVIVLKPRKTYPMVTARLKAIKAACVEETGQENYYYDGDDTFFWEEGKQHKDGAVTGQVFKYVDDENVKKVLSFRIEPDGKLSSGPKFFKLNPIYTFHLEGASIGLFTDEPTDEGLAAYVAKYLASFAPGGANEKLPTPVITIATVENADNGKIVAMYETPIVEEKAAA